MNIKSVLFYRFAYLFEIISILISLVIYYFTSKAFNSSVASGLTSYGVDYFSYIVLGEVLLAIPLYFLEGPYRNLKTAVIEGTWETMISLPKSPFKSLVYISTFDLPRVVLRCFITLALAVVFFGLRISPMEFIQISFFQILAIPFCFGFGLIACSLFILSGRGQAVIAYLTTLTAFLSGGFFPISVFPEWLREASYLISPFTFLLENSRLIIAGRMELNQFIYACATIIVWSAVFFAGHLAVGKAMYFRKKNGGQIIISN